MQNVLIDCLCCLSLYIRICCIRLDIYIPNETTEKHNRLSSVFLAGWLAQKIQMITFYFLIFNTPMNHGPQMIMFYFLIFKHQDKDTHNSSQKISQTEIDVKLLNYINWMKVGLWLFVSGGKQYVSFNSRSI